MLSILFLGFFVFIIASVWKVFEKAGQPGWVALIPIYNFYMICKISGVKNWWLIFIPIGNIIIAIMAYVGLAKSFGKGTGFAVGLILLGIVFFPILGFGDAQYIGPNGEMINEEIDRIGYN